MDNSLALYDKIMESLQHATARIDIFPNDYYYVFKQEDITVGSDVYLGIRPTLVAIRSQLGKGINK